MFLTSKHNRVSFYTQRQNSLQCKLREVCCKKFSWKIHFQMSWVWVNYTIWYKLQFLHTALCKNANKWKHFPPYIKKEIKDLVNKKISEWKKKFPYFNLCSYYLPVLFLAPISLAVPSFLPCSRQVVIHIGKIHHPPWILSFWAEKPQFAQHLFKCQNLWIT